MKTDPPIDPTMVKESFEAMGKATKVGSEATFKAAESATEAGLSGASKFGKGMMQLFGHIFGPK